MKITSTQKILVIFLIAAATLLLPFFLRMLYENPLLYGQDSIYSSRIISENTLYDKIQQREINFNLFFYIFSQQEFFQREYFTVFFPIILGLGTLFFLSRIFMNMETKNLTLIFFILSPVFVYVFSTFSFYSLFFFLTALGFLIFLKKHGWLSFMIFSVLPLLDFFMSLIVLVFLLGYALTKKIKLRDFYVVLVSVIIVSGIVLASNTVDLAGYFLGFSIADSFTFLGSGAGITFPFVVLALVGILLFWKKAKSKLLVSIVFMVLLFLSMSSLQIRLFFGFLLPFFAAIAATSLLNRKWAIDQLKNLTLILVLCSILFPAISFYDSIVSAQPTKTMVDSLEFLQQNSPKKSVVWSSPENGFLIQKYSQRRTFVDAHSYQYHNYEKAMEEWKRITNSRTEQNITELLEKNSITYFYITGDMREEYWNNKDQGLLFLLTKSETFIKIYDDKGIQIYTFKQQN